MIRKIVGIIGISIVIAGWVLSNSGRFDFEYKPFSSKYKRAETALNHLEKTNYLLEKGSEGFLEISKIAAELISTGADPEITAIKTLGWDNGQGAQGNSRNIVIEVYFSTRPPSISVIHNVDELIKARYYKTDIFIWSSIIFWTGVLLIILAL